MNFETNRETHIREAAEHAQAMVDFEQSTLALGDNVSQDRLDKTAAWVGEYKKSAENDTHAADKAVAEFAIHQAALAGNWDDERLEAALKAQEHVK